MKPGKRELRILEAEKEKARMYEKEIHILEAEREKEAEKIRMFELEKTRIEVNSPYGLRREGS